MNSSRDDEDDLLAYYERLRDDRKDVAEQVNREIERRRTRNRIQSLDRRIGNANREIEYGRLEEELAALYAQMRKSRASLLEEMSQYRWVTEKWHKALQDVQLAGSDAETELDTLLSEIHEYNESLVVISLSGWASTILPGPTQRRKSEIAEIETSIRALKSQCSRYRKLLR